MKKLFASALVAFSLAGCTSTQFTQLQTQTVQFIQQVQAGAAVACKVVPEAVAILSIFNAAVAPTVGAVVTAVCAAVPPPASARYGALPKYGEGYPPAVVGVTTVGTTTITVTGWRTK